MGFVVKTLIIITTFWSHFSYGKHTPVELAKSLISEVENKVYFEQFISGVEDYQNNIYSNVYSLELDLNEFQKKKRYLLDIFTNAFLELTIVEWKIHQRFNPKKHSNYFPHAHFDWKSLECNFEYLNLNQNITTELNNICTLFKSFEENPDYNHRLDENELAFLVTSKLGQIEEKSVNISERINILFRQSPLNPNYLNDDTYSSDLAFVKSCSQSFIENSGSLSVLFQDENDHIFREFRNFNQSNSISPVIPKLNTQYQNLPVQLIASKNKLISKIRFLKDKLLEKIRFNQKNNLAYQIDENLVQAISYFPKIAGKLWYLYQPLNFKSTFVSASNLIKDKNDEFGEVIFNSSLILIGSIFIPGPGIATAGTAILRLGTFIYATVLGGQITYTSHFLGQMRTFKQFNTIEKIRQSDKSLIEMNSDEISYGFFQGGITMTLSLFSEAFGILKSGDGLVGSNLSKFVKWLKLKLAENNAKTFTHPYNETIKNFKTAIASKDEVLTKIEQIEKSNLTKTEKLQQIKKIVDNFTEYTKNTLKTSLSSFTSNTSHFKRSIDLIRHAEGSKQFQDLVMQSLNQMKDETSKIQFIKEVVFCVLMTAESLAKIGMSRAIYLKALTEEIPIIAQRVITGNISEVYKFMSKEGYRSLRAKALAAKLILSRLSPEIDNSSILKKILIEKIIINLKGKIKKYESLASGVQTNLNKFPFVAKFLDHLSLKNIDEVQKTLNDPEVFKFFLSPTTNINQFSTYSVTELMYYIDKAYYLSDIIDDHMIRLAMNGGKTYLNLKDTVTLALKEYNQAPISKAITVLELSSSLSRIVFALIQRGENVSSEIFNIENYQNCSLND